MIYKSVKLYSDPEERMNENDLSYSEMTSFQRSFLSGLIKEKEPQKIVEIGVLAGGTTALIIQCLKMLGIKAEM